MIHRNVAGPLRFKSFISFVFCCCYYCHNSRNVSPFPFFPFFRFRFHCLQIDFIEMCAVHANEWMLFVFYLLRLWAFIPHDIVIGYMLRLRNITTENWHLIEYMMWSSLRVCRCNSYQESQQSSDGTHETKTQNPISFCCGNRNVETFTHTFWTSSDAARRKWAKKPNAILYCVMCMAIKTPTDRVGISIKKYAVEIAFNPKYFRNCGWMKCSAHAPY